MSQVNILAVDFPQVTESIGTSLGANAAEQGANSAFSEVMAKHQQQKSGNNSQQDGKKYVESSQESKKSATENKQTADDVEIKSANKTNESTEKSDSEYIAEQPKEQIAKEETVTEESLATSENSPSLPNVGNVAEQLLSFIMASDGMSTESTVGELADVDTVSKQMNKLSASVFVSQSFDGQKEQQNSQKGVENTDVEAEQLINSITASTVKEQSEGQLNDEGVIEEVLTKELQKQQQTTKLSSDQMKLSSDEIKLVSTKVENVEAVAAVAKAASDDKQLNMSDESVTADIISSMEKGATDDEPIVNLSEKKSIEVLSESIKSAEIDTKNIQSINDASNTNNASKQVDVVVPIAAVETAVEQKNSQAKTNAQVQEPSVNQNNSIAENSSKNQSGTHQQGNGESSGESRGKNDEQINEQASSAARSLVNEEAVKGNQETTDKNFVAKVNDIATESMLKPAHIQDSLANKTLAEKSLSYAEEQSIQNVLARANADSISTQSAKSAINIQNETIAIYRKDFSNAVKDKVMVMINQKIKQLEIRLDPPELGSMQVRLNLQNEQATVNFIVQNQQAKEALEQNIGKLKDMLAESGVDVGEANIEQRGQQSAEQEGFADQNSTGSGSTENEIPEQQMSMAGANLYKASATGVDYYA